MVGLYSTIFYCTVDRIRKCLFEYLPIFMVKYYMKPLFTKEEFESAKSIDNLRCECYVCGKPFYRTKHQIQNTLNPKWVNKVSKYCSRKCNYEAYKNGIKIKCSNCGKEIFKTPSQIKKSKSNNHFCSKSCAGTYNNTHKTRGIRRSKLEIYLEKELNKIYPYLKKDFNKTDTINSELDIYFPTLKLGFELNGIFHYEPIFGDKKLIQIQNNDNRKFQACLERNIELCIIDTSHEKYFKRDSGLKYLNIIIAIVNNRLSTDGVNRTHEA